MTYITEELKESFKDYLAEQSYIYDDNKQGLTHSYYWDYRDIIEPWLMKKLIEDYGDYPTVKDALHQYTLEMTCSTTKKPNNTTQQLLSWKVLASNALTRLKASLKNSLTFSMTLSLLTPTLTRSSKTHQTTS